MSAASQKKKKETEGKKEKKGMSKKRAKKERAEARAKIEGRDDAPIGYVKPPLARLYDRFNPGDYTPRQDMFHALFFFGFIVIVAALLIAIWIGANNNYARERESVLIIPAASFVKGQEQTIEQMLAGYGFKDIQITQEGDVAAFGTADMVQAYKDSYREKNVDSVLAQLEEDHTENGIESMSLTDDGRTLTIKTYKDVSDDPQALAEIVATDEMNSIIKTLSNWCGLRNGGEALTTVLVNVFDTTDGSGGTQYYSSTRPNGDQMVADLEKEQSEAAKKAEEDKDASNDKDKDTKDTKKKSSKKSNEKKKTKDSSNNSEK